MLLSAYLLTGKTYLLGLGFLGGRVPTIAFIMSFVFLISTSNEVYRFLFLFLLPYLYTVTVQFFEIRIVSKYVPETESMLLVK